MNTNRFIEDLTLVAVPLWWQNPWLWVAVALGLLVVGYFVRRAWLRRPQPLPPVIPPPAGPPPHLEALRRIASLRERHGRMGEYEVALECSDILRSYIHERFGIPIRFQTTREFLGTALSDPLLTGDARNELGEFLRFFDALKFARASADPSATLATVDGTERFVRRCIPASAAEVTP